MADDPVDWVDWGALERRIPLDELPAFHRAFLEHVRPEEDWQQAFLRRVQGKVQATLRQLERDGRARSDRERLLVHPEVIPEAFRRYLEGPGGTEAGEA